MTNWSPSSARFATPRDETRPSRGLHVDAHFLRLNRALPYPWQRYVNGVAGELNETGDGFRYPLVVLSVPRRAGKSAGVLATLLDRMSHQPGARCWYTAQTGSAASEMFRNEWTPQLDQPALAKLYKLRRSDGRESIEQRSNGSRVRVFAPERDALHGQNADLAVVDEAWSIALERGEALEAAIRPAQLTRPWRQLWIVSAGGTIESEWWDRWLTTAATAPSVALFDYGADERARGYDPGDPEIWKAAHPAVGWGPITVEQLGHEWETRQSTASFERNYLNVWPRPSTVLSRSGIDPELWARQGVPTLVAASVAAIALDVAADRSASALAIAGPSSGDPERIVVEVADHRRGVAWLAEAIRAIRLQYPRAPIVADSLVAASVVGELQRARVTVETVGVTDHGRACGTFVDLLTAERLYHRAQGALTAAVEGAARRRLGDAWLWSRAKSSADISPLVAATLAAWGASRTRQLGRASVVVADPPDGPPRHGRPRYTPRAGLGR